MQCLSVDSGNRLCLTTRWSRPGQPGLAISCDTSLGLARRLSSVPLGSLEEALPVRTWRAVTYISLAALCLGLLVILSTPLRFPGYIILPFGPVLTFLIPAFATCGLLIARLLLPHREFSLLLLLTGITYSFLALAGYMAVAILLPSLFILALMYLVSKSIRSTKDGLPPPSVSRSTQP